MRCHLFYFIPHSLFNRPYGLSNNATRRRRSAKMRFHRRCTSRIQNVWKIATHSPSGSNVTVRTISSLGYILGRFTISQYARTFPEYLRIGCGYVAMNSAQLLSYKSDNGTSHMNKKWPETWGWHGPCKNVLYNSHMPN